MKGKGNILTAMHAYSIVFPKWLQMLKNGWNWHWSYLEGPNSPPPIAPNQKMPIFFLAHPQQTLSYPWQHWEQIISSHVSITHTLDFVFRMGNRWQGEWCLSMETDGSYWFSECSAESEAPWKLIICTSRRLEWLCLWSHLLNSFLPPSLPHARLAPWYTEELWRMTQKLNWLEGRW